MWIPFLPFLRMNFKGKWPRWEWITSAVYGEANTKSVTTSSIHFSELYGWICSYDDIIKFMSYVTQFICHVFSVFRVVLVKWIYFMHPVLMIIHSCLRFLDPPPHIWQRSQKFQMLLWQPCYKMMHIIESEQGAKTLATLAPLTTLLQNDAHNWKWRGCQNSGNFGTSDNLVTKWCT